MERGPPLGGDRRERLREPKCKARRGEEMNLQIRGGETARIRRSRPGQITKFVIVYWKFHLFINLSFVVFESA